jgi:tetratricopeptide (TPR) repeat protein
VQWVRQLRGPQDSGGSVRSGPERAALCCFGFVLAFGSITTSLVALLADQSGTATEILSKQAQEAMATQDWPAAVQALEKLAALAPNVPEIQADLGLAYYSQNKLMEAAKAFERAIKLNPKMARAEVMLGLCYAELGRNRQAIPILASAFGRPADNQMGRLIGLDLQRAYAGLEQYDKAIAVAEELLKHYPNDPEILFQSSRLHADRAYELMNHLMQVSSDSAWVHYAKAEVHKSLQRYELAIMEYRKVLEMEPNMPGIHFLVGRAILQSSKETTAVDAALHEFELELATSPENSDAEYEMGEICRQRSQLEAAIDHFSKAVHYHPNFAQARIGLASSLMSRGEIQKALPHLLEAVRIEPQNEVAHFRLASLYKSLGDTANQQKEMTFFQKLHSAGTSAELPSPGASVTQQTIDP